jgi:hypothetical protein
LEAHLEWRYRLRLSLLLSLRENGEWSSFYIRIVLSPIQGRQSGLCVSSSFIPKWKKSRVWLAGHLTLCGCQCCWSQYVTDCRSRMVGFQEFCKLVDYLGSSKAALVGCSHLGKWHRQGSFPCSKADC